MDTDSFIAHIKADDIYKDFAKDIETRSSTSNFEIDRLLSKRKNKKVVGLMKDELREKFMKKLVGLRAKKYSYLKGKNDENKKPKNQKKKCVINRKLKFQNYEYCLEESQIQIKINCLIKNKIDLNSLKEDQKEFEKNNNLISKAQQ